MFASLLQRWWLAVAVALLLMGLLFVAMPATLTPYRSYYATSASMEPTLNSGDRFLASAYGSASPKRGDIIVFDDPHQPGVQYAKRIIGIPGDQIQFARGVPLVNGDPLVEHQLGPLAMSCSRCRAPTQYKEILPDGTAYRIIRNDDIRDAEWESSGVIVVPAESYFVVGDNRDNSRDSRMDDFGCIRREAIRGRAVVKIFDGTTRRWVWQKID